MKIFTTAVALDVLGADYRWRTSVYSVRQMDANGVVDGDLTLYGRGAPDFDSKAKGGLPALVDQLYERGLRRVRGSVIGDESYFRAETLCRWLAVERSPVVLRRRTQRADDR